MLASAAMRSSSGLALGLALGGVLLACGGKKETPTPAASSASAAPSTHKSAKVAAHTAAPDASHSADAPPKAPPKADPVFAELMKQDPSAVVLGKKVSLASLGVEWSIPSAWVVDDYTVKLGDAKEQRKGCHPPAPTSDTPYFDVVAPDPDLHKAQEWNGQDFPIAGQKPSGGPENWQWVPYVGFGLGPGRLAVIATHRQELSAQAVGEIGGPWTHAWLFFKHPKSEKIGQMMLTWKTGDAASQTILEGIAKSVTPL